MTCICADPSECCDKLAEIQSELGECRKALRKAHIHGTDQQSRLHSIHDLIEASKDGTSQGPIDAIEKIEELVVESQ